MGSHLDQNPDFSNHEQQDKLEVQAAPIEQVSEEQAQSALSRAYAAYAEEAHDTFIEVLIRPKKQMLDYVKIVGIILAYIFLLLISAIFLRYIAFLVPAIIFGGVWGAWYLITSLNREYEYVVTRGDLDIDMVIAQRRRKRVFSLRAKDIELMASCRSDEYRQYQKQSNIQKRDYSEDPKSEHNWFILAMYKGTRQLTVISPNERVIQSMHRYNPSRVRYNRMVGLD